jgi:hypothetical protein
MAVELFFLLSIASGLNPRQLIKEKKRERTARPDLFGRGTPKVRLQVSDFRKQISGMQSKKSADFYSNPKYCAKQYPILLIIQNIDTIFSILIILNVNMKIKLASYVLILNYYLLLSVYSVHTILS